MTGYAELEAASNFSFLRGASHPGELVVGAAALGITAIGVCDRNTLAGVVRAWSAAREVAEGGAKVRALTGCRLDFADETPSLIVYPRDREAYGRLTRLLTVGQLRAAKGGCELRWPDFLQYAEGQLVLVTAPERLDDDFQAALGRIVRTLPDVWLAASRRYGARDLHRLARLAALGAASGAPMVATNDVLYHGPERRMLQDVLTCIREGCTIGQAGFALQANAERHLKTPAEMARLFARFPGAVERSVEIAARIEFDLGELKYEYPAEPVPEGKTAIGHLRDLAWEGAAWRFPAGVPDKVRATIEKELELIARLGFSNYFLTVHDIVRWARSEGILCQGRGSAANSCVCFCLGITAVDPTKKDQDLLFSRFISESRGEPPDIDVDFEHERREEVMQYIYRRYGRERAAIVATVIHYRPRMAIREVGKVLGLTEDITTALANTVWGSWGDSVPDEHIRQTGIDPQAPEIKRATALAQQLLGFPRHLSQHVGGYVLTQRRLDETVPIGNAAMPDRTFIEWDKDDIDALGLMKVDVLALGMLTALKECLTTLGLDDIADIPQEAPGVYDMLCKADSVGVFQVESRAQMSMLPRLKPRRFYDLVIEVAIVRPGPIQGDMVHPYLRRREGTDPVEYPSPHPDHGPADELESILAKTMGVPLFQEQAMRIAIEAAKFSENDADGLRRSMATFRHTGGVGAYGRRFVEGMTSRGYPEAFALRCFHQIEGFGSYGFPESHAISFALLVYASAWVKWRHPDVFLMSLLNAQPMGFYQPSQLVRDAQAHGVEVRPPDVAHSTWDNRLEPADDPRTPYRPVRLGLRQVTGFKKAEAEQLVAARDGGLPMSPLDLARASGVSRRGLELLAEADAFRSQGLDRRQALWAVKGLGGEWDAEETAPLLLRQRAKEQQVQLPFMADSQHVAEDYRTTSLSLKGHPVGFFRESLAQRQVTPCVALLKARDRRRLSVAGLVTVRQRPGTAKGVVFMTLEDETGIANVVVWKDTFEKHRRTVMSASFLIVQGQVQRAGEVIHVVAEDFIDLTGRLSELREDQREIAARSRVDGRLIRSRDFH
ncbi:MAG: error-prone DNA polymerase [Alphaproteobacteria bacterium]|nr:error-prone DNA polymerase [Alphaproteobacteria bacterium]MBU1516552.1 error-prone DNA polymerase [Alphaproteobacteria bacterium]MBU2094309.1 error-prone DNA polymerase [Alphaproteobacteria bacterium]MBU2154114.1 error-prone DNA polymerase [Alphaproteobacteria bacterium]MBU2307479.1 error-prone DNA polymerase [Alphaproteobacteria bacterium]